MHCRSISIIACALLLGSTSPSVGATTICAASVAQINAAIAQAANDSSGMRIQIVAGAYVLGGSSLDNAAAPAAHALSMQGGYDAACATHAHGAATTHFSGSGGSAGLRLHAYGNLSLRDLSFDGLQEFSELKLLGAESDQLVVERVAFHDSLSAPLQLQMDAAESGLISLQNTLVVGTNNALGCVVTVAGSKGRALLANNTIAESTAAIGLCLQGQIDKYALGNIVWNISGSDVVNTGTDLLSVRNVYAEISGGLLPASTGDLLADPLFINAAANNFALASGSPAINSAGSFLPGGLATRDLVGMPRVQGSQLDRGALESSTSDLLTFTVTNTGDGVQANGDVGTLRRAIFDANAAGQPALIQFQIPGGCGIQQILIDRALPEINVPMTIDGSTQAGSTVNILDSAFDAQICVVIAASELVPSVDFALILLSTSDAPVTVRGLGFSGFFNAVLVLSGSGHRLLGNQFGGVIPFGTGGVTLRPNDRSVQFTGSSNNAIVGGPDPADRNLIAGVVGSTAIGLLLGGGSSHSITVRNNLIGIDRSGNLAAPLAQGIVASSSGHIIVDNHLGGASVNGIRLATADHVGVQNNDIGGSVPNGIGIVVTAGSSNNTIGAAADDTGRGNRITNNLAGGVWIDASAGIRNRVRDNQLLAVEGPLGGDAMVLDLGVQGADLNDPGDADFGPNNRLNFPLLSNLTTVAGLSTLSASIDAPVGAYMIDVYVANDCLSNGRAMADRKLLTSTFQKSQVNALTLPLVLPIGLPTGARLGATLTDDGGNTSELSNCLSEDRLFADGLE